MSSDIFWDVVQLYRNEITDLLVDEIIDTESYDVSEYFEVETIDIPTFGGGEREGIRAAVCQICGEVIEPREGFIDVDGRNLYDHMREEHRRDLEGDVRKFVNENFKEVVETYRDMLEVYLKVP